MTKTATIILMSITFEIGLANGACLPEGFTFTDGNPDYSKGIHCKSQDNELFFLINEDLSLVEEIAFRDDHITRGKTCQASKTLNVISFGDYVINRKDLSLKKAKKDVGNCELMSGAALEEKAESFLIFSLSKNKL